MNEWIDTFMTMYRQRDEQVIESLFNTQCLVYGTSLNEIVSDRDAVIEFFRNDLRYWGDVLLAMPIELSDYQNGIHLVFNGSVKMMFTESIQRDERYRDTVQKLLSQPIISKDSLLHVQWLLAHYTSADQSTPERSYAWPIEVHVFGNNEAMHFAPEMIKFNYQSKDQFSDLGRYLPNNVREELNAEFQRLIPADVSSDVVRALEHSNDLSIIRLSTFAKVEKGWHCGILESTRANHTLRDIQKLVDDLSNQDHIKHQLHQFHRDLATLLLQLESGSEYYQWVGHQSSEGWDILLLSKPFYWIMEGKSGMQSRR